MEGKFRLIKEQQQYEFDLETPGIRGRRTLSKAEMVPAQWLSRLVGDEGGVNAPGPRCPGLGLFDRVWLEWCLVSAAKLHKSFFMRFIHEK
jgi:hypothetical protein